MASAQLHAVRSCPVYRRRDETPFAAARTKMRWPGAVEFFGSERSRIMHRVSEARTNGSPGALAQLSVRWSASFEPTYRFADPSSRPTRGNCVLGARVAMTGQFASGDQVVAANGFVRDRLNLRDGEKIRVWAKS